MSLLWNNTTLLKLETNKWIVRLSFFLDIVVLEISFCALPSYINIHFTAITFGQNGDILERFLCGLMMSLCTKGVCICITIMTEKSDVLPNISSIHAELKKWWYMYKQSKYFIRCRIHKLFIVSMIREVYKILSKFGNTRNYETESGAFVIYLKYKYTESKKLRTIHQEHFWRTTLKFPDVQCLNCASM